MQVVQVWAAFPVRIHFLWCNQVPRVLFGVVGGRFGMARSCAEAAMRAAVASGVRRAGLGCTVGLLHFFKW